MTPTALRAALAAVALGAATCAVGARAERALDERVVAATAGVHESLGLLLSTGDRDVALNGAELGFASGRSTLDLATWTERAVAECKRGVPVLPQEFADALVARAATEDAAVVGCFAIGAWPTDTAGWVAALRAFARDLDLTRFGRFELLRARRVDDALHVLRIHSQGALPLKTMFPTTGDAPGFDLPGVPRVPGARRRLSSVERRGEPVYVGYSRPGPLAELVAEQGRSLREAGYRPLDSDVPDGVTMWTRGAENLLLIGQAQADESFVSLLVLGPRS